MLFRSQPNSSTGRLLAPGENDRAVQDWKLDAVSLFKAGRLTEARKTICSQASTEDIDEIFRWCYDNLELWSSSPEGQDEAIVTIRKGYVYHSQCADAEINLSAMLVELCRIGQ